MKEVVFQVEFGKGKGHEELRQFGGEVRSAEKTDPEPGANQRKSEELAVGRGLLGCLDSSGRETYSQTCFLPMGIVTAVVVSHWLSMSVRNYLITVRVKVIKGQATELWLSRAYKMDPYIQLSPIKYNHFAHPAHHASRLQQAQQAHSPHKFRPSGVGSLPLRPALLHQHRLSSRTQPQDHSLARCGGAERELTFLCG